MSKFKPLDDGMYFYPFVACCNCLDITQDWKWVTYPYDPKDEIYAVCKRCEFKVASQGI